MANIVPQRKRKVNINYSRIAKELKGKVSFKIDLRKTDSNTAIKKGKDGFSPSEKRLLTMAARAYKEYKDTANFVPIQRQAKESKTAFRERLSQSRKDMGQKGFFKGVWIDTPKELTTTKTRRVKNNKGKWTTQITSETKGDRIPLAVGYGKRFTKIIFYPIDPIAYALDPQSIMKEIYAKFPTANYINPVHSGFRGPGSGFDKASYKKFTSKLHKWSNQYSQAVNADGSPSKKRQQWLTGFLINYYIIVPEKGASVKKPVWNKKK